MSSLQSTAFTVIVQASARRLLKEYGADAAKHAVSRRVGAEEIGEAAEIELWSAVAVELRALMRRIRV